MTEKKQDSKPEELQAQKVAEHFNKAERERKAQLERERERRWWKALGVAPLFLICTGLLVVVTYYLLGATEHHRAYYDALLAHAQERSDAGTILEGNYLQFVAVMSPTRDVLELRAVTLLLGFAVVLLGGLFVLQRVKDAFSLSVETPTAKGALATASPGLVLISFGVLIVILALYRNTEITTNFISAVRTPPPTATAGDASEDAGREEALRPTDPPELLEPALSPQGSGANP